MDQKEPRFTRGEVEALLGAITTHRSVEKDMAEWIRQDPAILDGASRKLEDELARLA